MIPRIVSSLMFSPARSASSRAIYFPFERLVWLPGAGVEWRRIDIQRLPSRTQTSVETTQSSITRPRYLSFQRAWTVPIMTSSNGHLADPELDILDVARLDRFEPLVAVHDEGAGGAGPDQNEVGMDHVAQRSMSLRHKASRHSRSSASITSQLPVT